MYKGSRESSHFFDGERKIIPNVSGSEVKSICLICSQREYQGHFIAAVCVSNNGKAWCFVLMLCERKEVKIERERERTSVSCMSLHYVCNSFTAFERILYVNV